MPDGDKTWLLTVEHKFTTKAKISQEECQTSLTNEFRDCSRGGVAEGDEWIFKYAHELAHQLYSIQKVQVADFLR